MRSSLLALRLGSSLVLCVACVVGESHDSPDQRPAPDVAQAPEPSVESLVAAEEAAAAGVVTAPDSLFPPSWGTAPDRGRRLTAPEAWRGEVAPFEPGVLEADQRTALLQQRSTRRAFEGAPPPMRHSEAFVQGQFECLDCHRDGMWLGKRLARPMSHVELANCTQCHVEAANEVLAGPEPLPVNSFQGLSARVPSTVPHETILREDCRACHEVLSGAHVPTKAKQESSAHGAGWPAVPAITPHGSGDEARRDCRGCHVVDVDPSVEVAHPIGRQRFADCIACHRGDAHEPFGAPRVAPGQLGFVALPPASDEAAREACLSCHVFATPSGEIAREPGVIPPRIPHGILLRTRCISCHGEYGYAGLRIDHVDRSQCLQCHVPMVGSHAATPIAFR